MPDPRDIAKAIAAILLLSVFVSFVIAVVSNTNDERDACQERGGVYLMRDGVCLDKRWTK